MTPDALPPPQRRAMAANAPYRAHVVLTHTCNLACVHCYQAEHRSEDLSLPELSRLFREMADLGVLFLTLGGGEPLARRDFWEILAEARRLKFAVDLFTNATLVDDDVALRLKVSGVVKVAVSLHGAHADSTDAFVQRPGAHARIHRGIEALERVGMPVEVKTNVTRTNHRESKEIDAQFAGRLVTLKKAYVLHGRDDGDARSTNLLRTSETEEREAVRQELAGWTREKVARTLESAAKANAHDSAELVACQAARTAFAVMPNGDVTPCTVTGGHVMGNVRQRPLADIWKESAIAGKFRQITHASFEGKRKECASCEFRKVCARCPSLAHEATGSLDGWSAQVCQSTHVRWTEMRRRAAELGLACPV